MWKWVVVLLAVFALYKLITNDRKKKNNDEGKTRERKIASGELVKDPACGLYVDAEGSITVRDGDHVHHFCSYDCRKRFLDDLQKGGRELPESTMKQDEE